MTIEQEEQVKAAGSANAVHWMPLYLGLAAGNLTPIQAARMAMDAVAASIANLAPAMPIDGPAGQVARMAMASCAEYVKAEAEAFEADVTGAIAKLREAGR